MSSSELSKYAESICGNSWVDLNKHPELISDVMNHPSFGYVTQKYRWSLSIYFYCEGSPTGVAVFAGIDISKAKDLSGNGFDAIDKALLNVWN